MQSLREPVLGYAIRLQSMEGNETLRRSLEATLDPMLKLWEPLFVTCMQELGLAPDDDAAARLITMWLTLIYLGERLDSYMDQDQDPEGVRWVGIDFHKGTVHSISIIAELTTLCLESPNYLLHQALKVVLDGLRDCAAGQLLDLQGATTLAEYETIVQLKTVRFFRALFEALTILGQAGPSITASLAAFGEALGAMTQLDNDAAGIWGDGSEHDNDLWKGQYTYPVLYMLNGNQDPAIRSEFANLLAAAPEQKNVARMKELLEEAGAIRFINIGLLGYVEQARRAVSPLSLHAQAELINWLTRAFLNYLVQPS